MLNRKGYTLVELLGVVAIIGILLGGAGILVASTVQKQKSKIQEDRIKTIEDAAITYVLNKKYYLPVCKTSEGLVTISRDKVTQVNALISSNATYKSKRNDFTSLNSDAALKNALSGNSGRFGKLLDNNCYKLISIDTLIREGFVEKADECNVASNVDHSVIVIYSMGDVDNPNGAGQLVAVSDRNICS